MPAWPDWLWWTFGGALAALGLALLGWALLADRARGRRRCPRCWYDMTGTPGLTCSECGHQVRSERKLLRTRRRWRWVGLATLVMCAAAGSSLIPRASSRGWASIVPTSILLLALPLIEDETEHSGWQLDAFDELLMRRFHTGIYATEQTPYLWDWQWRIIIDRAMWRLDRFVESSETKPPWTHTEYLYQELLGDAIEKGIVHRFGLVDFIKSRWPVEVRVEFPETWPCDAPVRYSARVHERFLWPSIAVTATTSDGREVLPCSEAWQPFDISCSNGEPDYRGQVALPAVEGDVETTLTFSISTHEADSTWEQPRLLPWCTLQQTVRTHLSGHIDDFIHPLNDPDLDRSIRESFRWKLAVWHDRRFLVVSLPAVSDTRDDEVGDVARIEIAHQGKVAFTQAKSFTIGSDNAGGPYYLEVRFEIDDFLNAQPGSLHVDDDGQWTIRFRIDPIEIYTWHQGKQYWPGVIEQPIDWPAALAAREKWD